MKKLKSTSAGDFDWPALRAFLRGYLHEDWMEEYRSPEEAAQAFWDDADENERKSVAEDWKSFCNHVARQPVEFVNQLLRDKFGAAWKLRDPSELTVISRIFGIKA